MSVNRRNTRRGRRKPQAETTYRIVASTKMLGISFANDISDIVNTTEALTVNPTVTLKGTKAIFDYSHLTNQDDIDAINYLFQNVLSADDTVTVSDATHVNPLVGDTHEYDIAGTYTFVKYDPTGKIAILNQISINNKSLTYERYDYRYFTNSESLKFTTESTQTVTEERKIILNLLGADSENSFLLGFREMHVGDILTVQGVGDFTVQEYRINTKNEEEIVVLEDVPDTDLFGEPTLVTLKRREGDGGSVTKLFYPPPPEEPEEESTESDDRETSNIRGSGTARLIDRATPESPAPRAEIPFRVTPTPSISVPDSRFTRPRSKEISKLEQRKEEWLNSSRETIYVKVVKDQERNRHVYSFKGKITDYKWRATRIPDTESAFQEGKTYRFVQTDRTNKGHPLRFSFTQDGTHRPDGGRLITGHAAHTNKPAGSSNSHIYITIPSNLEGDRIFAYCANHPGMGAGFPTMGPPTRGNPEATYREGGPGVTTPGVGLPVGPGEGRDNRRDWINTCCTEKCIGCVQRAIREKETGDPCQDGPSGIPIDNPPYCPTCLKDPCDGGDDYNSSCFGCNAIKKCDGCRPCPPGNSGPNQPCCENNSGPSSPCWSCGPYMIKKEYYDEAKRACTGRPNSSEECCQIPNDWEGEMCKACEGSAAQIQACCDRKKRLSELVMRCWWRLFTRNGGCQSGNGPCQGYPNPDGKCWTCEDLAKGHNGGPCRNANDDYWPCKTGSRCGIQKALCNMGGECDDCCNITANCRGASNPPLLTPQDKSCCGGDCGQSPDGPRTTPRPGTAPPGPPPIVPVDTVEGGGASPPTGTSPPTTSY